MPRLGPSVQSLRVARGQVGQHHRRRLHEQPRVRHPRAALHEPRTEASAPAAACLRAQESEQSQRELTLQRAGRRGMTITVSGTRVAHATHRQCELGWHRPDGPAVRTTRQPLRSETVYTIDRSPARAVLAVHGKARRGKRPAVEAHVSHNGMVCRCAPEGRATHSDAVRNR